MSISDKITRLAAASDNIAAAIATKGGTVGSGDGFEDFAADIATIPQSGGAQPALNAPTISRSGNIIYVSNPSTNGNFAAGFKIYDGNTLLDTRASQSQFDLTSLGAGSYSISTTVYGTNFEDSPKSNVILASVYTVERNLTNLSSSDSSTLISDGVTYNLTLTPASGYYLPEDISVYVGGTATSNFDYNNTYGFVTIPNVSGSIRIVAAASLTPPRSKPIYGVSGLYGSNTALTRTDDAVGMDFVINSSTGAIDSDFDNVFPWRSAEIVTLAAGKFIRLPKMYFRVGVDSFNRITDIAVSEKPGNTGNWYEVESFDVACYGASINGLQLRSNTGQTRLVGETRATFRQYAENTGTGFYQYDYYHHAVLQFLWLIEWATKDSASIMTGRINGSGTSGGNNVRPTGGTDNLTTPSGFETAYAQMRWHYIEDFNGNLRAFYDGIISTPSGQPHCVTTDPSKFSDNNTEDMSALSFNDADVSDNKNCIIALGWDDDHPFFPVPIETVSNGSFDTGFCDGYYNNGTNYTVVNGGSFCGSSNALYGLFCVYMLASTSQDSNVGSRLLHSS